jgi:hypothetical protein
MTDPSVLDEAKGFAALGGGATASFFALRWLERAVRWVFDRMDKRQAELDAEDETLKMGWKDYRLFLERRLQDAVGRLDQMEVQNRALRTCFEHVAAGLIELDPQHPSLQLAARVMAAAFPGDFTVLSAMASAAVDRQGGQ